MNRSTLSRLVIRLLLVLIGATLLDTWVVSRLAGLSFGQRQMVVGVLAIIALWIYVLPLLRELLGPRRAEEAARGQREVGAVSEARSTPPRQARPRQAIVAVAVLTSLVWICAPFLLGVERQAEAGASSVLRTAVMITGLIAAFAILLMPIARLTEKRGWALLDRSVAMILLIAAFGWWLAPALVLSSAGLFDRDQFFSVIFPITYVFLPALALALRTYRGR